MNLAQHYRTLGLRRGASSQAVKNAYRTLVRQYHPDINPDQTAVERFIKINDAYTILSESIQLSERKRQDSSEPSANSQETQSQANKGQVKPVISPDIAQVSSQAAPPSTAASQAREGFNRRLQDIRQHLDKLGFDAFRENDESIGSDDSDDLNGRVLTKTHDDRPATKDAEKETHLKQDTYRQLKGLLRQRKFPRAIALIEGLAHRMPQDSEITQWQAIIYQRWGRQLIHEGQTHKARMYLKKALRTDPNNRALWREVNLDFWQLTSLGH